MYKIGYTATLLLIFSFTSYAIDNDWYQAVPEDYSSSQIETLFSDNICEIRASALPLVLRILEKESYVKLGRVAKAELLVGPCYKAEEGLSPYLIRAVSVGGEITAARLKSNKILTLSLSMGELVTLPTGHREHTPVHKSAIILNLEKDPAEVIPSLMLHK